MKNFYMPSRKREGGWAQLAISGVGLATSLLGGMKSKSSAKKAGKAQADLILKTHQENRRRKEYAQDQSLGLAAATSGASGLMQTGSTKVYQDQLASEYQRELQWMDEAAKLAARAAKRGASQAGDMYMQQGFQSAIGYAGQYASSDEFQKSNWWNSPSTTEGKT